MQTLTAVAGTWWVLLGVLCKMLLSYLYSVTPTLWACWRKESRDYILAFFIIFIHYLKNLPAPSTLHPLCILSTRLFNSTFHFSHYHRHLLLPQPALHPTLPLLPAGSWISPSGIILALNKFSFAAIVCWVVLFLFFSREILGRLLCSWKWGPAAHHSTANKEARLGKEKFALVWMPASGGWGGRRRVDFYPKSDPPLTISGQELL